MIIFVVSFTVIVSFLPLFNGLVLSAHPSATCSDSNGNKTSCFVSVPGKVSFWRYILSR